MHAECVGELMGKQDLVGVVFAGGLSEAKHLKARQLLINDKHSQLINLFRVLSGSDSDELIKILRNCIYHPQELEDAKKWLDSEWDA